MKKRYKIPVIILCVIGAVVVAGVSLVVVGIALDERTPEEWEDDMEAFERGMDAFDREMDEIEREREMQENQIQP